MCILFIAIERHPEYPLVVVANRDEFHPRPTKSAHFWPQPNPILAGLDLQAGGTWLGINQDGEFSALTNIRSGLNQNPDAQSRGELVPFALAKNSKIDNDWLTLHSDNYNPFNLIFQKQKSLFCYNSIDSSSTKLNPGFHAICNGSLDDVWPKMAKGEQALEQLIAQNKTLDIARLFSIMQDRTTAPDELLPNTGVGIEWERKLSSIFIQSKDYGTRSTSVMLKHNNGDIDFYEQSYTNDGAIFNEKHFAMTQKG